MSTDSDNDGVPDNEEIIAQTVDNSDLDAINSDNDYKLTIDINAAGYANNSTTVEDSGFSYITSTNPAVLGKVVAIDYAENLKVDSAVLKFEIPQATVNSVRNYPDSTELAGLNRYAIFHYSKEYNIMYPINVEYDESSSILKVNTNELGDYFVVDLDKWFYEMGIVPDQYEDKREISTLSLDYDEEICYTDSDEASEKYTIEELEEIFDFSQPFGATEIEATEHSEAVSAVFSAPRMSASFSAEKKIKPVDVVFIIDCTDNLQDNFENVKANVISASEEIFAMCDSARICIIQFWASKTPEKSGWYSNGQASTLKSYVNSIKQLDYIESSLYGAAMTMAADLDYRSNAKTFNFLIFDVYSQWSEDMTGEMIKNGIQHIVNKGINFSILYDHTRTDLSDNSQNLIKLTDGYDGDNLGVFSGTVADHIYKYTDKISGSEVKPEPDNDDYYVVLDDELVLGDFSSSLRLIDNIINDGDIDEIHMNDNTSDYDEDGLKDYQEIDWDHLVKDENKLCTCRSYGDYLFLMHGTTSWGNPTLLRMRVLPILSNPWENDSDEDGINDKYDAFPINSSPLQYQKKYNNISMNNSSRHILEFVAPENGYYRFELYYDSNEFEIGFIDGTINELSLENYIGKYNDKRIYNYLEKGDKIKLIINSNEVKSKKYNLYITKVTAYLCGGKFDDGLDTTADISELATIFYKYGFDVIRYTGNSFKDVYEFSDQKSPFAATHSEVFVISSHGIEGYICDYTLSPVYMPYDNIFNQNIVSLFSCCYSSSKAFEGSVIDQCVSAGAQTAIGFSNIINNIDGPQWNKEFINELFSSNKFIDAIVNEIFSENRMKSFFPM